MLLLLLAPGGVGGVSLEVGEEEFEPAGDGVDVPGLREEGEEVGETCDVWEEGLG